MPRYVDLTPTWATAVRVYCAVLRNPHATAEAAAAAEQDLLRLADIVDSAAEAESAEAARAAEAAAAAAAIRVLAAAAHRTARRRK
jgi:hypothetical protein